MYRQCTMSYKEPLFTAVQCLFSLAREVRLIKQCNTRRDAIQEEMQYKKRMHSIVRHHGHHLIFKLKDQNGRGKNGLLPQSWDLGPELFW